MENKTLPEVAKSSKGSIIAATIVGLAVVGGAASSLVDTPQAEDPIKVPAVERAIEEQAAKPNAEASAVQPAAVQKTKGVTPTPVAPITKPVPKPVVPAPKPEPSCSCPVSDLDCGDFDSGPDAQAVYECCLKQGRGDYHRLDRDKDGTACDTLW